ERAQRGRIHIAAEGVPEAAEPAPPRVTLRGPVAGVIGRDSELPLTVRCSAACDVRVQATSDFSASDWLALPRAGSGALTPRPEVGPIAPRRSGPVKLLVRSGAPGARRAAASTLTLRLRRPPPLPVPRVLALVARRDGKRVVVTFRTDRQARPS